MTLAQSGDTDNADDPAVSWRAFPLAPIYDFTPSPETETSTAVAWLQRSLTVSAVKPLTLFDAAARTLVASVTSAVLATETAVVGEENHDGVTMTLAGEGFRCSPACQAIVTGKGVVIRASSRVTTER